MEQYYVVLSSLTSQARAHAFSTEERAKRFQRLQFEGAGHLFTVRATEPIVQNSGTQIRIVYRYTSVVEPLSIGANEATALAAARDEQPELRVVHAWWEPVLAANEAGLTHYHVSVADDATLRVVASFVHGCTCHSNCALESNSGQCTSVPGKPVYHVAASSPEEALEIVSQYHDIEPAGTERSARVMEVMRELRAEIQAHMDARDSSWNAYSFDVDGEPWIALYDRHTGYIMRVYLKVGVRFREVIHPDLPFSLEHELVRI